MTPQTLIVRPQDAPRSINVLGTEITLLAPNSATQGYEITLQSGEPGMGPPPHSHRWDESFYVLRGRIDFICAGQAVQCLPGTLVHVPGGTVHSFSYGADGGQMLEITGAGGQATRMFGALSELIPPGLVDRLRVTEVLAEHGVTVHG